MKLDSESPYHQTCPTNEHAAKVIIHNDNHFILPKDDHFTVDMLKIDKEALKEGKHGLMSPVERKSCKAKDTSEPHSHLNMEHFINNNENEGECMEAPYSVPTSEALVVKEEFYTDKAVTKVELPEMIVCIKDGAYHIVKDICIDEGVHVLERSSVEKNEVDQQISCSSNQSPNDGNDDLTKAMTGTAGSHDLKYTLVDRDPITVIDKDFADLVTVVDNNPAEQCSSRSSVNGEEKLDTTGLVVSNISAETVSEQQLLPSQQFDTDSSQVISSSLDCSIDQLPSFERQKIDQGTMEEGNSTSTTMPSAPGESNQSCGAKEIPANCKVPSGSNTINFESGTASISGKEENKEKADSQQSEQAQNGPGTEEAALDGATASARSSFLQHTHGDSNLSGPALLSGPVASSGHIPYSGSISLRSDSSTTSARSFAFPILQSEWNSSPVKMAKADRRSLRKHRCWRTGLLCCRF